MFKKFISSAAAVAMLACISAAPLSVSAENSKVQFEIGTISTVGEIRDGVLVNEESVLVPVDITENEGVATFMLEFTLDSNFEVTGFITRQSELPDGGFMNNKNALRILWTQNSCEDIYTCGNVLNLRITVPAGTPVGQYEVGFNSDEIQLTNSNFESLDVTLVPGYINVGGDPQNDSPVITEPAVTNPPETQAPPAVQTTQNVPAPANNAGGVNAPQKDPQSTTVNNNADNAAAPVATSAPVNSNNNNSATSAADSNVSQAVTTTAAANGNSVSDAGGVSSQSGASVTGDDFESAGSSSSADSKNNSNSSSADKSSASSKSSSASTNKTSNSPSTGAGGIAIAGVVLTISAVGAVAAYKVKKNK